ncbi:MAG: DOMON domain-containing protein, partial [Candidatus Hodarchaeota archaeon]
NDTGVFAFDSHATGRWAHGPDADQTRIASFGFENQSGLFIEMTIKMASEDADDIPLEQGAIYEFWFVWHATQDAFTAAGHSRTSSQFFIEKADTDHDDIPDPDEQSWGTDPNDNDTDDDGLSDGWEAYWEVQNGSKQSPIYYDPTEYDTDGDGINDALEDYDLDGIDSLREAAEGTSPFSEDTDNDGLSDGDELDIYGTDPLLADTDGDVLSDGEEVAQDRDPLKASLNIPYTDFHQGAVDGAITPGEYRSKFTDINHTKITANWEHDGELLYIALVSNTTGWLSFGWSKEPIVGAGTFQMKTMDLVIGRVMSGSLLEITDHHGTSNWTHSPELDFNQIERAKGLDNGYTTTIEFALRLKSDDVEEDVPLETGQSYFLALAYGLYDELGLHDGVTRETVQFYIAVPIGPETPSDEEKEFNPLDPFDLTEQLDLLTAAFLIIAGFSGIGIMIITLYTSKRVL